jgi:hypothetical protein
MAEMILEIPEATLKILKKNLKESEEFPKSFFQSGLKKKVPSFIIRHGIPKDEKECCSFFRRY